MIGHNIQTNPAERFKTGNFLIEEKNINQTNLFTDMWDVLISKSVVKKQLTKCIKQLILPKEGVKMYS